MLFELKTLNSSFILAVCAFLWQLFLVPFVALFREPSISIEESDSDAPVAVDVVNP